MRKARRKPKKRKAPEAEASEPPAPAAESISESAGADLAENPVASD
jgi:hypothetical protein